jgi:two-component system, cell cycle response regulator DivK
VPTAALPGPILLVDDFEDALEIYSTYLGSYGYRVVMARDGAEALTAAERETPGIILLDLRMPVMDGTSTLKKLRQDPRFVGVPVVALTAHALDDERAAALSAGFDLVVSKPCLPDELLRIVRRLIGGADGSG